MKTTEAVSPEIVSCYLKPHTLRTHICFYQGYLIKLSRSIAKHDLGIYCLFTPAFMSTYSWELIFDSNISGCKWYLIGISDIRIHNLFLLSSGLNLRIPEDSQDLSPL